MSLFADESVADALERALDTAEHLHVTDAAAVAAARALARKIDAWDTIVDWALDDAAEREGSRPAVPAHDNVSIATFLKYLDSLRLIPQAAAASKAGGSSAPRDELQSFRAKRGIGGGAAG